MTLKMQELEGKYAILRLSKDDKIPDLIWKSDFYSITKTHDELSIVVNEEYIPIEIINERDFKIFKVIGPLPFELTDIISELSKILAKEGIGIFVISTYDTSYLLIREHDVSKAITAFRRENIKIKRWWRYLWKKEL